MTERPSPQSAGNDCKLQEPRFSGRQHRGNAAPGDNKNAASVRHVYGPRPLASLVPGLTRPAFRRHSPAAAQVMADWTAIVGPAIAAIAAPRRLAAGTLTLGCTGAVAMELQHLALELIGRINTHLGSQAIHRLRFAQGAGPVALAAPAPALSCSPKAAAKVDAAVEALPQGPLRDALAALGRAMLAPRRASTARGESS